MRKIIIFIKILLRSKIFFSDPKKNDLIVFDDESLHDLKDTILKKLEYTVVQNRLEKINKIYISKNTIFYFFKNLRLNLFDSYLLSIIDVISPKVIFTFTDNCFKFSKLAKIKKNTNIVFLALQNGARYQIKEHVKLVKTKNINTNLNQKIYLPKFLCFGDYEKNLYKKYGIKVGEFIKVGSLRLARHLEFYNKKEIKNLFDICLLSDFGAWRNYNKCNSSKEALSRTDEGFIKLIKFTIKFTQENNLKLIFVFKKRLGEENWYKKYLSKEEYKYLYKNSSYYKKSTYKKSSYLIMRHSKIVLATMSTMLRENLALNRKTLSCNFTKDDNYNFPINGACSLKEPCNFEKFSFRLKTLLNMSRAKFISQLGKKINYTMYFNSKKSTADLVSSKIQSLIKNNSLTA